MSWKIAPRLQEAAEARPHAAGSDSLWEVPEKAVHEALKAKPKLQWPCWRGQDRGAAAKESCKHHGKLVPNGLRVPEAAKPLGA